VYHTVAAHVATGSHRQPPVHRRRLLLSRKAKGVGRELQWGHRNQMFCSPFDISWMFLK